MKFFFSFLAIFILSIDISNSTEINSSLKCSQNGTEIIFIPGIYTSSADQIIIGQRLGLILDENKVDSKTQHFNRVPFVSQGVANDKIVSYLNTLSAQDPEKAREAWHAYWAYEKGMELASIGEAEKKIFKIAHKISVGVRYHAVVMRKSRASESYDSSILGSYAKGYENSDGVVQKRISTILDIVTSPKLFLNMASLVVLEKAYQNNVLANLTKLVDNYTPSSEAYSKVSNTVEKIENYIKIALDENKKIIFLVHGEGGQLAQIAYRNVKLTMTNSQINKMNLLIGTLASSKGSAVDTGYSETIKTNIDKTGSIYDDSKYFIVSGATDDSGLQVGKNIINSYLGSGGSSFLGGYLTEGLIAQNTDTGVQQSMQKHYIEKLIKIGEDLESNCEAPKIHISSEEAVDLGGLTETDYDDGHNFIVDGYASKDRLIKVTLEDYALNDSETIALKQGYAPADTAYTYTVKQVKLYGEGATVSTTNGSFPYVGNIEGLPLSKKQKDFYLEVPYADYKYVITINAKNANNLEANTTAEFELLLNKTPVITVLDRECYPDANSFRTIISYKVSDDEEQYDGKNFYVESGRNYVSSDPPLGLFKFRDRASNLSNGVSFLTCSK